jgi:hypothetical protein
VPAGHTGTVRARLDVAGPALGRGRLQIRWQEGVADARAQIRGILGAAAVIAQTPAP